MRYQITETPTLLGKFDSGATVTITLYDLSDESTETLDSNSCNEVGSTGVFAWSTSNITTQPTVLTEYLWIMSDGTISSYGKVMLGGYPENIDAPISTSGSSAGDVADAVWDELVADHTTTGTFGKLIQKILTFIKLGL